MIKKLQQNDKVALCLLTFLSLLLRIFKLDHQSLWYDEVFNYFFFQKDIFELLTISNVHPPFFSLLVKSFDFIMGTNSLTLRLPSALAGTLCIPVLFLTLKMIFDRKTALLSSVLLMISPIHIHYSQEGRLYAIQSLLLILSTYFLFYSLKKQTRTSWLTFSFMVFLSLFTSLVSGFFFLGISLFLALNYKEYKQSIIKYIAMCSLAITGVSYYLWQYLNLPTQSKGYGTGILRSTSLIDLGHVLKELTVGRSFGVPLLKIRSLVFNLEGGVFENLKLFFDSHVITAFCFYLFVNIIILYHFIAKSNFKIKSFFSCFFLCPLLVTFLFSFFSKGIPFNTRYVMYLSLTLSPLLVHYLFDVSNMYLKFTIFGTIIALSMFSNFNHYFVPKYQKINMKGISIYLKKEMKKNDIAFFILDHPLKQLNYFFPRGLRHLVIGLTPGLNLKTINKLILNKNRVFIIKSIRGELFFKKELLHKLDQFILKHYAPFSENIPSFPFIQFQSYKKKY